MPTRFRALAQAVDGSDADLDRIKGFADVYGFLASPVQPVFAGGEAIGYGESLELWRRELAEFRALAELWQLVDAPDSQGELARRKLEARVPGDSSGRRIDLGFLRVEYLWPDDLKGRLLRDVVRDRLLRLVEEKLASRVRPVLQLGHPLRFRPDSVIAAAYLDFALEVIGEAGSRIRECQACHKPYRATRRDSKFCSDTCRSRARHLRKRLNSKEVGHG